MNRATACLLFVSATAALSPASSLVPLPDETVAREAGGICHGRVESLTASAEGGRIRTRVTLTVLETLKGTLPEQVEFTIDGGVLNEPGRRSRRGMSSGASPDLQVGEERLFLFSVAADGSLVLERGADGARRLAPDSRTGRPGLRARLDVARMRTMTGGSGADLRRFTPKRATAQQAAPARGQDQAASGSGGGVSATGLSVDGSGVPSRFLQADRGQPIRYLIDDTQRPAGMSRAQVQTAVQQATAAWAAATSLTFVFDGFQAFGQSAGAVQNDDGRLRIQTYNGYGDITSGSTLGIGGRYWVTANRDGSDAGAGGQVAGLEFHRTTNGYVVMNHTASGIGNPALFAEVMCHEIGHALGFSHSSENAAEANATLREAVMYYTAHNDGRGATLGSWDGPVARKAYPQTNTPPWCDTRYITMLTGSTNPTGPGLNELTLAGYDRQTASASLTLISEVPSFGGGAGTWSRTGSLVKITPAGNYGDADTDLANGGYFDIMNYRYGDGVNCSPWTEIIVGEIRQDTWPSGGDGMPNAWMLANFGSTNPAAGPNRGAAQDWDGDGFTNLQEYRLGTDPKSAASRFTITGWNGTAPLTFPASPWRTYVLETSTNMTTWQPVDSVIPENTAGSFLAPVSAGLRGFHRVRQLQ